jgi:hypothetical protein
MWKLRIVACLVALFVSLGSLERARAANDSKPSSGTSSTAGFQGGGGGGFWFQSGYGFGSTADRSPRGMSFDFSGYGFGYPNDWLRIGGFGQNVSFTEDNGARATELGFGGGGPLVGYDARLGETFYAVVDFGLGFGSVDTTLEFRNAEVSNIQADNLRVSSNRGSFGMSYMLAAQFGAQLNRGMRIGLRLGGTYATNYAGRSLVVPSAGIDLTFGAFPPMK